MRAIQIEVCTSQSASCINERVLKSPRKKKSFRCDQKFIYIHCCRSLYLFLAIFTASQNMIFSGDGWVHMSDEYTKSTTTWSFAEKKNGTVKKQNNPIILWNSQTANKTNEDKNIKKIAIDFSSVVWMSQTERMMQRHQPVKTVCRTKKS